MSILQDPDLHLLKDAQPEEFHQLDANLGRLSEESLRTEDCDGPVAQAPMGDSPTQDGGICSSGEAICSDRAELIERIKKGESPTWVPNQAVS